MVGWPPRARPGKNFRPPWRRRQGCRPIPGRPAFGATARHGKSAPMATQKRLLLVDDDAALRQSLAEQLTPEFDTVQAASGSAALEAARAGRFDAVLLDVGLPDLDGREV